MHNYPDMISPMPNAQCPKSAGDYPSPSTRGWSFPPTFNELPLPRVLLLFT
ncbi:hypothetical protein [Nostoc sp.]|uniref:hypothetical protein n=1 Tax=Nostoc sp. TaxID=1180 RepID=UPI002FFCF9A5